MPKSIGLHCDFWTKSQWVTLFWFFAFLFEDCKPGGLEYVQIEIEILSRQIKTSNLRLVVLKPSRIRSRSFNTRKSNYVLKSYRRWYDGTRLRRFFGQLCAFLTVKKLPLLGNETVSAYWLLQPYIFRYKSWLLI